MSEALEPIRFPQNLQRAIDLDLYGHPHENIAWIMDSQDWDLKGLDNAETPSVSDFEKACAESAVWVRQASARDEHDLLVAIGLCDPELIAVAATTVDKGYRQGHNPLKFALTVPVPIELTLLILALFRRYGSGGEAVNIVSGLPPKPPSPGRWGGRTPGFEQPLPINDKNLDVGDTERGR